MTEQVFVENGRVVYHGLSVELIEWTATRFHTLANLLVFAVSKDKEKRPTCAQGVRCREAYNSPHVRR